MAVTNPNHFLEDDVGDRRGNMTKKRSKGKKRADQEMLILLKILSELCGCDYRVPDQVIYKLCFAFINEYVLGG